MLKIRIKASKITNLTDARYFAAWEAHWLGFNLDSHTEGSISPQQMMAIKEWVEGPKIIGEFGLQSVEEIKSLVDNLSLDGIQLGMMTDETHLAPLQGIPIIKEIVIEKGSDFLDDIEFNINTYGTYVSHFLIDFSKNGISYDTFEEKEREFLKEICAAHSIILDLPLQQNMLEEVLDNLNPFGLNVQGGEEEKVGLKSFDELDDIFEALETFE